MGICGYVSTGNRNQNRRISSGFLSQKRLAHCSMGQQKSKLFARRYRDGHGVEVYMGRYGMKGKSLKLNVSEKIRRGNDGLYDMLGTEQLRSPVRKSTFGCVRLWDTCCYLKGRPKGKLNLVALVTIARNCLTTFLTTKFFLKRSSKRPAPHPYAFSI